MAMGKAVIVTRTRGQTGVISGRMFHDGHFTDIGERAFPRETGIYVPPRDPASLRGAVEHLLNNPEIAAEMGRAGRAAVESAYTIEAFTQRLSRIITGARESLAEPAT
jgi:glycosyltransferase involved in cell wall biosynthesis